jgi:hypothetical protein
MVAQVALAANVITRPDKSKSSAVGAAQQPRSRAFPRVQYSEA